MPSLALVAAATALLFAATATASSTWRCGSSLVSLDDSAAKVRAQCGEPAHSSLVGFKETRDDRGFHHEVQVEEWVYGPNHGMYHFLRFEGNRLRKIDSRRGD